MHFVNRLAGVPAGRTTKWFVVVFWLLAAAALGPLSGRLTGAESNDASVWLPRSAESTRALHAMEDFAHGDSIPAVVVYARDTGLSAADRAEVAQDRQDLLALADGHQIAPPTPASDGTALLLSVPLHDSGESGALHEQVSALRQVVDRGHPDGLTVAVTGPAGQTDDFVSAFDGLDVTVLLATVAVVAAVLLLTYRSPVLWLVPLLAVGVAAVVAQAVVYLLASHAGLVVNAQSSAILTVLVFAAGTDYALLLVARYREELHRHTDRHVAMVTALRRAAPAVFASSSTVVIGLLCLLAAELNSNRGLGPVGAVGVACALATMTTLLPALLVVLGRWVFWPFVPRVGTPTGSDRTVWGRIGRSVARRPRAVWVGTALLLGALTVGSLSLPTGLSTAQMFTTTPESTTGQQILADHFPAGASAPVDVVADAAAADRVGAAVRHTPGVAGVSPPDRSGGRVHLSAVLDAAPDSPAASDTVVRLRDAVHRIPGAHALVGGPTATTLDTDQAISHDKRTVIPLVLAVVFTVLVLLLRALVAPLLLLGTVVLSFAAALGASTLLFDHVFGFGALDASLVLTGFIFLVALGIDYNIFLMTRVREEALRSDHRTGVLRGLAATGGVITSAGVVLAATFSVLGVLPLVATVEMGVLVALGVLLDTFVVRSVLVPALALDTGRALWWPGRLARREPRERSVPDVTRQPVRTPVG